MRYATAGASGGPEGAEDVPMDDAATAEGSVGQELRDCHLLDLQVATQMLGSGTEHPGSDTEPSTCQYSNAGVGVLSLQLVPAESYDQMTILPPHTPVEIGDRARHNVQTTGVVAVQFVRGAN